MTSISLPFTDAFLRLGLPFPGLSVPLRVFLTLLLLGLFSGLLVMLYRYETRLIRPRFAVALLTLRLISFALIFLTLSLEPVLARSVKEEVPGKVLIAVDRSDSMKVTDPTRPLAEKLRIAKVLKLVPDLASDAQLEAWAKDCETGGLPRFALLGGEGESRRFEAVVKKIDEVNRLDLCSRILTKDGLGLIDAVREKHGIELIGFGKDVIALPVGADRLAEALSSAAGKKDGQTTLYTDLKLPLIRASKSVGDGVDASGPKLLGVVLLTDGRHNWGESPALRARELGERKVPVFSVAIAPKDPPADIAVVSAQAQAATVFKGSIVPVEVGVRITGWPAGKVKVSLDFPTNPDGSKKPPLEESVDHDGRDAVYPLTFKAKMDEPGPQLMTVTAEGGEKDRFPENNRRSARVNVVKDRAKVMLIDGESRWEFHYLHTCLGRDPNMDIRSTVFRQPRIGKLNDEELRKMGTPANKLPDDLEVLTSYDCIVLGDVEQSQMNPAQREAIEKYVAESGGTLVMLAGKRAMPLEYANAENDPFRKLLPLRNPKAFISDDGFPLNITGEGERSWFLSMGDTAGQNRAAWDRLPLHYWATVGELKDGAEALAVVPGGGVRDRAVIARQSYGFGRVLYVGIDSTWRWRFKVGDFYHHRFWGQVAQWAASDRLLPVTNATGTIRFGTREPIYSGGQEVEFVVRTSDAVKKLGPNSLKGARVIRLPDSVDGKETSVGLIPLTNPDGRPRDLSGKAHDLTPGKYAVELEIPEWTDQLQGPPGPDGRATKLRCTFEVAPPDNEELVDLAANLSLLEELAQAGGGKVYTIENAKELVDALAAQSATREYFIERPLRQSWWILGVFLAFITLEWILRKWAGLP
ncbi:hypothetical protein [Limnoglobus roseus]|uniref:VWA domain-containing protein n=1 Tax=Limnoglobus roseus TaxID=2598579 RepID=A0A5C1AGH5_9BACT|nr:hypothetical protein [Limnoglobus roseus]QEL16214.1 VWA domain-containing protein [Limnoglobus roseus]